VDTSAASYVYDARGNRVRATLSGSPYDFIFQGGKAIDKVTASNWIWGDPGGLHVASYVNSTTYFDHIDWLGTVRARSSISGGLVETCASLAFGDGLNCAGADLSSMHFTDQPLDSGSNLTNFLYRQLSTTQGRWTTPDPVGLGAVDLGNPQTWNRYTYATGDPLGFTDPLGLACYPFQLKEYHRCPIAMPAFGMGWDEFQLLYGPYECENGDCGYIDIGNGLSFLLTSGVVPANNGPCVGNTMQLGHGVTVQTSDRGVVTATVPLVLSEGYTAETPNAIVTISPNTSLTLGLQGGTLTMSLNNPLYIVTNWGAGAYVSSATFDISSNAYSNAAFTQVNGTRSFAGIPLSSWNTPSKFLLDEFNQNPNLGSLGNAAKLLQTVMQIGQSLTNIGRRLAGCNTPAPILQ